MEKPDGENIVYFSSELREEVENMFSEMHEYYKKNYTPKVKKTKACTILLIKRYLSS